jgi:two-component system invasion response regulator UvrY
MKARLIIADDHPMVCQGLGEMVARTSDLEIIAIAHDGFEAERLARSRAAELLMLDIAMPACSGINVLESLRASGIQLPVLFFTMYPATQYVTYVRQAGAQGFIGKAADEKALLTAIRKVVAGRVSFPAAASVSQRSKSVKPPVRTIPVLSERENEVLGFILRGVPLVSIAQELGITAHSVTTYRRRILDKLAVRNNAELIRSMGHSDG